MGNGNILKLIYSELGEFTKKKALNYALDMDELHDFKICLNTVIKNNHNTIVVSYNINNSFLITNKFHTL